MTDRSREPQAPEGGEHTFRFAVNKETGLGKESGFGHLAVFGNKFVLSPPLRKSLTFLENARGWSTKTRFGPIISRTRAYWILHVLLPISATASRKAGAHTVSCSRREETAFGLRLRSQESFDFAATERQRLLLEDTFGMEGGRAADDNDVDFGRGTEILRRFWWCWPCR